MNNADELNPAPQPGDHYLPHPDDGIDIVPPVIAPGRVVLLVDGRIGIIDSVRQPQGDYERAYVLGVNKEFAVWVLIGEVKHVYGVAAATGAATA